MASVNLSEDGAETVMQALLDAGIGIEAGIWSVDDAERLAASGFATRVVRVLVEIVHPVQDPAAEAMTIDERLDHLGIAAPRLHHGVEDALFFPDGALAPSNEALVLAARLAALA